VYILELILEPKIYVNPVLISVLRASPAICYLPPDTGERTPF